MKLLWLNSVNASEENLGVSPFYKKALDFNDEVVFLYERDRLAIVAFNKRSGEKRISDLKISPRKAILPLPHDWEVEKKGTRF